MTRHRINTRDNMDVLGDVEEACRINPYAIGAYAQEFEVACRKAIGRIGEAAAQQVLKDVILSIQGEVS